MSEHGRYALGFGLGLVNKALDLKWYGTPVEILATLSRIPLSFSVAHRHKETVLSYFVMYQDFPLFEWHGGPNAEALFELLDAVHASDLPTMRKVLRRNPQLLSPETSGSHVPLLTAVLAGNLDQVGLLTPDPLSANLSGHLGLTALHWAASLGNAALVSLLLSRGADPNVRSWFLLSPAEQARLNRARSTSRLLRCKGFPLTERGRFELVVSRMAA
jgi:ankyrin repeat protein